MKRLNGSLGRRRARRIDEPRVRPPTDAVDEATLATWALTSLVGVVVGLGVAKYAQVWAQDMRHPGAAAGALIIINSVTLTVVAASRYSGPDADAPCARRPSRALAMLSSGLVAGAGWTALMIIGFGEP